MNHPTPTEVSNSLRRYSAVLRLFKTFCREPTEVSGSLPQLAGNQRTSPEISNMLLASSGDVHYIKRDTGYHSLGV
ncbi:hypothetical protein [Chryseobacterium profundimaris]|uniref:hypothetical protein n=1 Tax=Chryseobacterium profundimaris TaxID=1387275 RepID=UPI0024B79336|nr:hypothetical protein [Chryseobacterium profundimaris]